MAQAVPADSVRFAADAAVMSGPVDKLYLEPEKKQWKHRYTFDADGSKLCGFFDERALPEVTVYVGGEPYVYRRQTLRMAQLRADRVSDIRYDSCKRTVVFGSRGHPFALALVRVRTGNAVVSPVRTGLRYGEIRFGTLKNGGLSFLGARRCAVRAGSDASSLVRRCKKQPDPK